MNSTRIRPRFVGETVVATVELIAEGLSKGEWALVWSGVVIFLLLFIGLFVWRRFFQRRPDVDANEEGVEMSTFAIPATPINQWPPPPVNNIFYL